MADLVNLRAVVLDILMEVNEHGSYSHIVIKNALDKYAYLEKNERAFITRLTEGTIERQVELDYIINQFSKTKVNKMKPLIRNIIRMAVYQIEYMSQVPDSAACNEAVKLAVKRGFGPLRGFVNGVLRNIARDLDKVTYPNKEENPQEYLSVVHSVPQWIVEDWYNEYGFDKTEQILCGMEEERKTYIRCNTQKTDADSLEQMLLEEGCEVERLDYCANAMTIAKFGSLRELKTFARGMFFVQDSSSIIAGMAASPGIDDYVLDVCAAPGGKAIHAAMYANGEKGHVEARDVTASKTALIMDNVERLGLNNLHVDVKDATVCDADMINKADVLIADLPCSGLGIMGRKADIRYKMTKEKQESLVKLQREMLDVIWQYVKPGGILIYSTCTINRKENQDNIEWFTKQYPFEYVSLEEELSSIMGVDADDDEDIKRGFVQLLPGVRETDGFFVARLRRLDG